MYIDTNKLFVSLFVLEDYDLGFDCECTNNFLL